MFPFQQDKTNYMLSILGIKNRRALSYNMTTNECYFSCSAAQRGNFTESDLKQILMSLNFVKAFL